MNMILANTDQLIESPTLLYIINQARLDAGQTEIRANDFHNRVADELEGEHYETFVVQNPNKTESKRFRLTGDQCMLVSMRESKTVRRRVLDQLKLIASQNRLPDFTNPSEAARAWAELFDKNQEAKAKLREADQEVERLQGVCHTIAKQFEPGLTPAAFCRNLNGVNTQKVQRWLVGRGYLMHSKRGYQAKSYYRDRWFAERAEEHEGKLCFKVILTKKGAINLYKLYLKGELPMKSDWDGTYSHYLFDQPESTELSMR